MRVMFVIPGDGAGCSMIFARRQAAALVPRGVQVVEFYLRSRTSPRVMVREMLRFRREAGEFRPHVIHAQFGTATAMFAAIVSGRTPLVITFRGSDLNPSPGLLPRIARGLSQMAALKARAIVCVSAALRERLWWRRSRAAVAPSGVDPRVFFPAPRESARERLGWRVDQPVVLFNAGMDPRVKRIDLARAAIAAARRELPDLCLEVLDGSTPAARMPVLMNASDCLLVTSDREGSPTVVQEALASNLPVVSVDVGDVRERLSGVRNTRVVERDPPSLARAIVELVCAPLRSDGSSRVDQFCEDRITAGLIRVYQRVIRREASGAGSEWNISPF